MLNERRRDRPIDTNFVSHRLARQYDALRLEVSCRKQSRQIVKADICRFRHVLHENERKPTLPNDYGYIMRSRTWCFCSFPICMH